MAILVTRPHPDNETTARALRARGFEVLLAPMLRFEPVTFQDDADARYGAVIVTSANALRGDRTAAAGSALLKLPLFAVGEHTAAAATRGRFRQSDLGRRRCRGVARARAGERQGEGIEEDEPAALSRRRGSGARSAGELGERGFTVVTQTTYRMVPLPSLPREICEAFAANGVEAVLHYSRRSARAFIEAVACRRRRNIGACRCRNAAFPPESPPCFAMPGRRGSWSRHRRMKMPYLWRWSVLCGN